ncbi:hypothetical protein EF903_06980 [Streptomyces sp. WAC05292]|uniref:hypothetical protein n=1 Tax=Streptomyces sp. WAC05292 TaxID=2487418 RepID=UPI000F7473F5|nr:hypothetical protein [Streptomyces sp. WAC05292]RSS94274.1 hypothetical protein EF903_06980 [Streptomyces sp. WAC05292]
MPKPVTFTITIKLLRQDGPPVDVDDVVQELTNELENFELYVEDGERDTETHLVNDGVVVARDQKAPARM